MNEQKRLSNEMEYDLWFEKPDSGRIYSFENLGRLG
jgi:hypothetical protein